MYASVCASVCVCVRVLARLCQYFLQRRLFSTTCPARLAPLTFDTPISLSLPFPVPFPVPFPPDIPFCFFPSFSFRSPFSLSIAHIVFTRFPLFTS